MSSTKNDRKEKRAGETASKRLNEALQVVWKAAGAAHSALIATRRHSVLGAVLDRLDLDEDRLATEEARRALVAFMAYGQSHDDLDGKATLQRHVLIRLRGTDHHGVATQLFRQPLQAWSCRHCDVRERFVASPALGPEQDDVVVLAGVQAPGDVPAGGAVWGVILTFEGARYLVGWRWLDAETLERARREAAVWDTLGVEDFWDFFELELARMAVDPTGECKRRPEPRSTWLYNYMRPSAYQLRHEFTELLRNTLGVADGEGLRLRLVEVTEPDALDALLETAESVREQVLDRYRDYEDLELPVEETLDHYGFVPERVKVQLEGLRRHPVALLTLSEALLERFDVDRLSAIGDLLHEIRDRRGADAEAVREAWRAYVREQRWVDMSGLSFQDEERLVVLPRRFDVLSELPAVVEADFLELPLASLPMPSRGRRRFLRALEASEYYMPPGVMACLPESRYDLETLDGVGVVTVGEVLEGVVRAVADWRWQRAGLDRRHYQAMPLGEEGADALMEGLDELADLFD